VRQVAAEAGARGARSAAAGARPLHRPTSRLGRCACRLALAAAAAARACCAHAKATPRGRATRARAASACTCACAAVLNTALARAPRQAVYQICGLRSLFPDDAFTRRSISGLNNVLDLKARRAARAGQPAQHLPSLGGRCLALLARCPPV
jgi:hypothetical protein